MDRAVSLKIQIRPITEVFENRKRQMGKIETIVSDTWLNEYGGSFERFAFNVPVWLNPPIKNATLSDVERRSEGPEPYRVDMVGSFGDEVELIEVKESANMTAIGQLLTYRMLFMRSYFGFRVVHLRIVCSAARDAIVESAKENGINLDQMYEKCDHLIKAVRRGD